ncbi:hypothetical protein GCM10023075_63450 [Streptosporangium album]
MPGESWGLEAVPGALERWSEERAALHDVEPSSGAVEPVDDTWLGFPPASEAEVAALEERLGCALPPSFRPRRVPRVREDPPAPGPGGHRSGVSGGRLDAETPVRGQGAGTSPTSLEVQGQK